MVDAGILAGKTQNERGKIDCKRCSCRQFFDKKDKYRKQNTKDHIIEMRRDWSSENHLKKNVAKCKWRSNQKGYGKTGSSPKSIRDEKPRDATAQNGQAVRFKPCGREIERDKDKCRNSPARGEIPSAEMNGDNRITRQNSYNVYPDIVFHGQNVIYAVLGALDGAEIRKTNPPEAGF